MRYSTATRPSGGRKQKGETPTGEFITGSMVSLPTSRRSQDLVERCCSCTRHSNYSTKGPSTCVCKCRNASRKCNGGSCWGRCKNRGRLLASPTTARGLLGLFQRGADLPATGQCDCLIANTFVPKGNIGGLGRGKGRKGRGERPQGTRGGRGGKRRRAREERGHCRMAARRARDKEDKNDRTWEDDGRDGAQKTSPRTGKQQRRRGRALRERWLGG